MTGLTPFLCKMLATDRADLARADPTKLATKYGINPTWARNYIADRLRR